jgi:prepilin-type N-terminal cleavage/methylation domain-containing protein
MKVNQKGFSVVEILIVIVVVGVLGAVGWLVYDRQKSKTDSKDMSTQNMNAKSETPKKETEMAKELYGGWKTYTSKIGSGLTFKYPADWYYPEDDSTTAPFKNNLGGSEADRTLYSVKPTFSKPTSAGGVSTNQYLCVSIDEYTSKGWGESNWQTSKPVKDIPLTINGKTVNFGLFAGSSPMLSELYINNPHNPSGDHFITTKEGYVVSIKAAFNYCQQSGGEAGITNPQADFMEQPEVKTAELILQSIKF